MNAAGTAVKFRARRSDGDVGEFVGDFTEIRELISEDRLEDRSRSQRSLLFPPS